MPRKKYFDGNLNKHLIYCASSKMSYWNRWLVGPLPKLLFLKSVIVVKDYCNAEITKENDLLVSG